MSVDHLATLHQTIPSVFDIRTLPPSFDDGLLIIPIENPESTGVNAETQQVSEDAVRSGEDFEGLIDPDHIFNDDNFPIFDDAPSLPADIISGIGGGFGGAPVGNTGGGSPPTDCLAFYLPFHYFYPDAWGVYILAEGVLWLAKKIVVTSGGAVGGRDAITAARLFLYYHESFHHKTECFATRLEITHRMPFYKKGFENLYRKTLGTDGCLEEGLAEATALMNVFDKMNDPHLRSALCSIVESGLPGYRRGVEFVGRFQSGRAEFSEANQRECLPSTPSLNPEVWFNAGYMFSGIANIKSRVNYVIPKGHPLSARLPFRPRLSPDKVIKKLHRLCGLQLQRHGGRHDIYITSQGNQVSIPRHSTDLGDGLIRSIISEAGLSMSITQFINA